MDTLFIVFDRHLNKQELFEKIHNCCKRNLNPCYKSVVYSFKNDRKILGNRIIDTVRFSNFKIIDSTLFETCEKENILSEIRQLEVEYKNLHEKKSDEGLELLSRLAFNNFLIEPATPIALDRNNLYTDVVYLSKIVTDEDFLRFEDRINGKKLYLIDITENDALHVFANRVFYTKMSPERLEQ